MANATPTSSAQTPRPPNAEDLTQLTNWLLSQGYIDEDAIRIAESAFTAVFDEYCTGCPGYCGRVMSVVWDGGPSQFDVFFWSKGKMERSGREYDEKACDRCGETGGTLCCNCWRTWAKDQK